MDVITLSTSPINIVPQESQKKKTKKKKSANICATFLADSVTIIFANHLANVRGEHSMYLTRIHFQKKNAIFKIVNGVAAILTKGFRSETLVCETSLMIRKVI